MSWIQDIVSPPQRRWEEFYRNRWQHDKIVRSTHGVNCTGGCSWQVYVKDGIVTWEMQALDYPDFDTALPPYEPRGCQRGISFSWYIYSPIRVKYPYVRGTLMDLWRAARQQHSDPVDAWTSVVEDPEARRRYQQARGKGGFRRTSWDEVLEIVAAASIYTAKKYGPDRVIGFSPIPAMSQLSYAAGSRFLQLFGGVNLSFYDWYSDLPPASPEMWGEQTDVQESADWYHAKYIVSMGSNLNMTRTPDVHFVAEARHEGTKFTVLAPDFSQAAKYADWWIPLHAGQDGAFWMAANHVILKEFYVDRQVPYFVDYIKRYTDCPLLVTMTKGERGYEAGRFLRANAVGRYKDTENGDWKFLVYDDRSNQPRMPKGAVGHRWAKEDTGKWNLEMKDALDNTDLDPVLSLTGVCDEVVQVELQNFEDASVSLRGVPIKYVDTEQGQVAVATVFDLLMARYGIPRGLPGDYPTSYDDDKAYTPSWQERFTGIDRKTLIKFAQEFAGTAEATQGKCTVIIGAGINHWYHNNLIYRSAITALVFTGCVGRNGGGLAHYVGQEKLAPVAPWQAIAMARDWLPSSRLQNAPSWHYVNTDQWRYERSFNEYAPAPVTSPPERDALGAYAADGGERAPASTKSLLAQGHTMDMQARAVRLGWLPFYPQFNRSSIDLVEDARRAGARTDEEVIKWLVDQLSERKIRFSVEDPDAPENWPRVWFIWRGNALMSSAKGHEYFLKHYLGTHSNTIGVEVAEGSVSEVEWRPAPEGKMDLVVDINFRMDTSALYSDIVLPTATWYEKNDLNSTDLHTYIHPLSEAVPPCWESKTDWEIFKAIAKKVSALAETHLPEPVKEIVATPLAHDTVDEIAQPEVKDWTRGETLPVPGKSMPHLQVVERDYVNLHRQFISFGPLAQKNGIGAHGVKWGIGEFYDELLESNPTQEWNGGKYPSLEDAVEAANVILHLAPETNGDVAYKSFKEQEKRVGVPLADLAEGARGKKSTFMDLQSQPRRLLTSPCWTGIINDGRTYSPFCMQVERLVPWRTLTGRQQLYHDHEVYIAFGENLPAYKPGPDPAAYGDFNQTKPEGKSIMLNYLTPHGKWHIHSTYYDNHRMLTLSRGVEPFWINDKDAVEIGVVDNDWVEAYNDHGVVVTRCTVSARVPRGACLYYHSPERTISVPKSPLRGNRRAGGHNSLTRTRLKPVLMAGGYGQFTYHFNYWGPTGVNRDTHVLVRKLEGKPVW